MLDIYFCQLSLLACRRTRLPYNLVFLKLIRFLAVAWSGSNPQALFCFFAYISTFLIPPGYATFLTCPLVCLIDFSAGSLINCVVYARALSMLKQAMWSHFKNECCWNSSQFTDLIFQRRICGEQLFWFLKLFTMSKWSLPYRFLITRHSRYRTKVLDVMLKSIDEYVWCEKLKYVRSFVFSRCAPVERRKFSMSRLLVITMRISP